MPFIVTFYLMRRVPELMLRQQEGIISLQTGFFTSVEATFLRALTNDADFRELTPEFYMNSQDIYVNAESMDLGLEDPVGDVELPLWARDSQHFGEIMREALESDYVSEHLNEWIDLIFGCKGAGGPAEASFNRFPDSCYPGFVDWSAVQSVTEKEAMKVLLKDFGQCPKPLFSEPHPQRSFRWSHSPITKPLPQANPLLPLRLKIEQLQGQLQIMTNQQAREVKDMEEDQMDEIDAMKAEHSQQISKLRSRLEAFAPRKIGKDTERKGFRRNASLGVPLSFHGKYSSKEIMKTYGYESARPTALPSVSSTINLLHKQLKPVTESPVWPI